MCVLRSCMSTKALIHTGLVLKQREFGLLSAPDGENTMRSVIIQQSNDVSRGQSLKTMMPLCLKESIFRFKACVFVSVFSSLPLRGSF